MDFRQPTLVGERINLPFFAPGLGIDNGWALSGWNAKKRNSAPQKVAVVEGGNLTMEVWTNFPCLQVYTGNYVEKHEGKSGRMYDVQTAICLEAEDFPDAAYERCDLLICEASHDEEWVRSGPYPYQLKQRILGDRGHLSNEAGAELAALGVESGARTVVLAHLSAENNTPARARQVARMAQNRHQSPGTCLPLPSKASFALGRT